MPLFLLQENSHGFKSVGIPSVLVVQNGFLVSIFMGLEAHLNYVLRKIKLQVILTFIFYEHNILSYWSFSFEELEKNQ